MYFYSWFKILWYDISFKSEINWLILFRSTLIQSIYNYIYFSIHTLQQLKFIIVMKWNIKTTLLCCNDLPRTHFSFHQNLILNPWMCLLPYCRCFGCVFKSQYWNFKRRYVNNEAILTWLRVVEEGLSSASEHNVIVYNAIHLCWVRLVDKRH